MGLPNRVALSKAAFAVEALVTSLKVMKAWPFILKDFLACISRMSPNCENKWYKFCFNSSTFIFSFRLFMYKVWLGRMLQPVLLSVFSLLEIFISFVLSVLIVLSMVFMFPKLERINMRLTRLIFKLRLLIELNMRNRIHILHSF